MVNAVCLFNSLYLDEAVRHLRADGERVADEDLARVSPLAREHVRMLGRYHFALDESVAGGGLRPLRNPSELGDYELPPVESGEPPP
ncbi:MAG: Tn3 family transposase [Rubrobacter sp.]|nr:Tn3 family transposase [Rubrobacter sp.]